MIRLSMLAALFAIPSAVHASEMRVLSYEMSETGGKIVLEADAPIGEPWTRFDRGSARIWFPQMIQVARFNHVRDIKEPIRSLQLRPGAENSAVLNIELGAGRVLAREDLVITRSGQSATIEIRVPVIARALPAALTPQAATDKLTPKAAADKPTPSGAGDEASPPAAAGASLLGAATQPDRPLQLAAATQPLIASKPAAQTQSGASNKLDFAQGPGANLGMLLALSVLLAGLYGLIRAYGKKRVTRTPEIQILSARKLGHRQELLLVRALGADHLIMCSPNRVERVASVPIPSLLPAAAAAPTPTPMPSLPPAPEADSQAHGLGVFSKLSSRYRVRRLLDAVDQEAAAEPRPVESSPSGRPHAFGPELLSAMRSHKLADLASLAPTQVKQSESVAGIARLRGRVAN